jgi:hypothetical protein
MSTDTRPAVTVEQLLAEYNAWADGELSEISDAAMAAGRESIWAIHEKGCQCDGCAYARQALREAYQRVVQEMNP